MASLTNDTRRELLAGCSISALLVCGMGAAIVWMPMGWPPMVQWPLRVGFTTFAIAGLVGYCFTVDPKDEVTDYLRQLSKGNHFDVDGFAFLPTIVARNGIAYLEVLFQNQRDCEATCRVVMEPLSELFRDIGIKAVEFEIPSDCGDFGVARVPIAVPAHRQGVSSHWNIGAGVAFPKGKAGRLRFQRGLTVGQVESVTPEAQGLQVSLAVASLLVLAPSIKIPARVKLQMPCDVRQDVPDDLTPEIEIFRRRY